MQVGDLIREIDFPTDRPGLIVGRGYDRGVDSCYLVLCPDGRVERFEPEYIEEECEVISESR
jgi:hypothetical protein